MDIVYIVINSVAYSDSENLAVFSDLDKARNYLKAKVEEFNATPHDKYEQINDLTYDSEYGTLWVETMGVQK